MKRAFEHRTRASHLLHSVLDALREVERIERGGDLNPNWPDPRASIFSAVGHVEAELAQLKQAMEGKGQRTKQLAEEHAKRVTEALVELSASGG